MLNAVHIGDPMSTYGRSLRSISLASSRLAGMLKSHGQPSSGSFTMMSKAKPSVRNSFRDILISAVTLGGDYNLGMTVFVFAPPMLPNNFCENTSSCDGCREPRHDKQRLHMALLRVSSTTSFS